MNRRTSSIHKYRYALRIYLSLLVHDRDRRTRGGTRPGVLSCREVSANYSLTALDTTKVCSDDFRIEDRTWQLG